MCKREREWEWVCVWGRERKNMCGRERKSMWNKEREYVKQRVCVRKRTRPRFIFMYGSYPLCLCCCLCFERETKSRFPKNVFSSVRSLAWHLATPALSRNGDRVDSQLNSKNTLLSLTEKFSFVLDGIMMMMRSSAKSEKLYEASCPVSETIILHHSASLCLWCFAAEFSHSLVQSV